jgi:hypothetical protein
MSAIYKYRNPVLQYAKCTFGFHAWVVEHGYIHPHDGGHAFTIIWWTCEECWKSKIKFIGR